jgi:hypothetical protein
MASETIGYGGGLTIAIDRPAGRALRLHDGGWQFAEPPPPAALADSAGALAFLCGHLKSLCDPWAAAPRRFLDGYFAFVAAQVAHEAADLEARLARFGGLYRAADFAFAALRPLPRARLGADGAPTDVAFWTGAEVIALDLADTRRTRRQRAADHDRLARAGARVVELAADALATERLAAALPAGIVRFLDGETLPASPFKAAALGDVVDADPRF